MRLLVSVRSGDEARAALAGGADWIDVKEPSRGALGMADPHVWQDVRKAANTLAPLSAALGELLSEAWQSEPNWRSSLAGYGYVKVGLAGCGERGDWPLIWRRWAEDLPKGVAPVAVIYADQKAAASPAPSQVLDVAAQSGAKAVLFDTYEKGQGDLLRHFAPLELRRLVQEVKGLGMLAVVGGSLRIETLPLAIASSADVIAVRGAACGGARESSIDKERVRQLAEALKRHATASVSDDRESPAFTAR